VSAPELAEIGPVALDGIEVWDRHLQAPAGSETRVAFVSVRAGGVGLNKYACKMLGRCDAVRVTYDPKRHRLGIVPGDPEAKDTYLSDNWCQVQVSCRKLFEYYGVDVSETRRCYDLEMVDGVLIANLGGSEAAVPERVGS